MTSLVVNNLCTVGELSRALGVNRKNIEPVTAWTTDHKGNLVTFKINLPKN